MSFTYMHSTHQVTVNLGSAPSVSFIESHLGEAVIVGAAIVTIAFVAVLLLFQKRKRARLASRKTDSMLKQGF